jgi:hypothetical protein
MCVLDASTVVSMRLVHAVRFHEGPVQALAFNSEGDAIACLGAEKVFFVRGADFQVLGYAEHSYLATGDAVTGMGYVGLPDDDVNTTERLVLATRSGLLVVINTPSASRDGAQPLELGAEFLSPTTTEVEGGRVHAMATSIQQGERNVLFAMTTDKQLRSYAVNGEGNCIQVACVAADSGVMHRQPCTNLPNAFIYLTAIILCTPHSRRII